jgi:A/G-specific adenine glycosylase
MTFECSDSQAGGKSSDFAERVVAWQRVHGRHDLPWQNTRNPYRIWVSEIMLQQTQVSAVLAYYQRFIARFPDVAALAEAHEDDVLACWSGLGYYARARNLRRAAQTIVEQHAGRFPDDYHAICALPGIGRSTASAICAFAFGMRKAILDGNVKRVLARRFGVEGFPGERHVEQRLWALSEALVPGHDVEAYTQGLMDLGARVCVRSAPACGACPLAASCVALRDRRTAELPAPRPARVLPQRETTMLVLWRPGEVLLEKRPSSGIWGGLWCFPEVDGQRIEQEARTRFAATVDAATRLGVVEHGFTHYRLRITPVLARATQAPGAGEPGRVWITPEDALTAAIPVPVRRILQALTPGRIVPAVPER